MEQGTLLFTIWAILCGLGVAVVFAVTGGSGTISNSVTLTSGTLTPGSSPGDLTFNTSGGPGGNASQVPAMYVYDYMFQAQNLGQGFAASTMMLLSVLIVLIPWAYLEFGGKKHG